MALFMKVGVGVRIPACRSGNNKQRLDSFCIKQVTLCDLSQKLDCIPKEMCSLLLLKQALPSPLSFIQLSAWEVPSDTRTSDLCQPVADLGLRLLTVASQGHGSIQMR